MCECYKIGGPFIAEDPTCPIHGDNGIYDELEDLREEVYRLRQALTEALKLLKI